MSAVPIRVGSALTLHHPSPTDGVSSYSVTFTLHGGTPRSHLEVNSLPIINDRLSRLFLVYLATFVFPFKSLRRSDPAGALWFSRLAYPYTNNDKYVNEIKSYKPVC